MGSDLPFLVWVDCEMTGLNTERDALVEIAVLITDAQLNDFDVADAFGIAHYSNTVLTER